MKRPNIMALKKGDVIDAVSFNDLVVRTYKKNLEIRQRKERAEKN